MVEVTAKINDVSMVEIPSAMCEALKIKMNSKVSLFLQENAIILQIGTDKEDVTVRKLDEFNRIVLPAEMRKHLKINQNEEVSLKFDNDKIIITR